jgi:hypothetical protein
MFRTRRATAATFRPAQALTAHSAQTTAPISRSTVGRDGSAKNLLDSEWRANGISPIAAGGGDTETRYLDRSRVGRQFPDDDDGDDVRAESDDSDRGPLGFFLFGRRPRW